MLVTDESRLPYHEPLGSKLDVDRALPPIIWSRFSPTQQPAAQEVGSKSSPDRSNASILFSSVHDGTATPQDITVDYCRVNLRK